MGVIVVGVSYRYAPLEKRERLAYPASQVEDALAALLYASGATAGVLLSTCNRTELYLHEGDGDAAPGAWAALSARLGEDASAYGYVRRDHEAVAHLFRVAAGLDSMILGEAQIQGQVRDALEASRAHSGPVLHRLFQSALSTAGRVRSETRIAHGAASVSSAAVQLAKQIFGSLRGLRAMVLGAGEMAELALETLASEGVRTSVVANRTPEHAWPVAARYGARVSGLDGAWRELTEVDLLLCSTAAPAAIVTSSHVRGAAASRDGRPLCILDIALPRDVDPEVRALENVFLYDLDDLHAVVSASLERRREELPTAEQLIACEVSRWCEWYAGLAAVPVLTSLRGRADAIRARELDEALRRLGPLSAQQHAAVEHLSRALMNKLLHEPSVRLRAAAAHEHGLAIVDAVRYLFALDESTDDADVPRRSFIPDASTTHLTSKGER